MMARTYTISEFVQPFKNVPLTTSDETLEQIIELTSNSHTPIYVFSGKKYQGIVSGYSTLFQNHHAPLATKVSSTIIHTPRLHENTSLYEAIRAMMDTRMYELPIFDTPDNVIGVIRAHDVLDALFHDEMIATFIAECVRVHQPVTASIGENLEHIYQLMKKNKISRIILINDSGELEGIVARSDIKTIFIPDKSKPRTSAREGEVSYGSVFETKDFNPGEDPISKYAKTRVFTLPHTTEPREIIRQLHESKYNSVVLVDRLNKPVGFLSLRDILHCLATFEPDVDIPIVFEKPNNGVPERMVGKAQEKIEKMIKKMQKMLPVEKVEISVEEQKYANQKVAQYQTNLLISIPGNNIVVNARSKDYLDSVNKSIDQAERKFIKQAKINLPNKNNPPPPPTSS